MDILLVLSGTDCERRTKADGYPSGEYRHARLRVSCDITSPESQIAPALSLVPTRKAEAIQSGALPFSVPCRMNG